ncbi:hypothetical protein IMZ29_22030 [Achromobacter sp. GG226]|uniref:hypothetical protein n=1 Tax=Verticiella alkaliphila TaxID=2779529 RepID=UPI001C0DED8F|nr:hypothetical protein [Verticiella sp. GG226]MBU4613121.1 hypothetical protein [Verticiella sp. GG226]
MRIINTLTVTYDENEDRLHLAARCADGHEQGLWLTQRLANLLIKVLADRLSQASAVPMTRPVAKPAAGASAGTTSSAGESRATAAVPRARTESEPVEVPRTAPHGLIHTINVVRHAGGGHHLVLRWETARALALPLDGDALRRVLQVLHLRYRTAEWPLGGVWPEGIESSLQGGAPPDTVLH